MTNKRNIHPWLILMCICLLQGAGLGILNNCTGLYFVPVMHEFGIPMAKVTLFVTIKNLMQCISTVLVAKVIFRFKLKYVISIAGLIVGISQLSLAFSHSIIQWYVCAVIQGVFIVYLTGIIAPLVISNWFTRRTGFALGMTSMSAGLFGALMSSVLGFFIVNHGWRVSIMVSGIVTLVLTIPFTWAFIALTPEEKRKTPYGGFSETDNAVMKSRTVVFDLRVVAIVFLSFCCSFGTSFNNHLSPFGTSMKIMLVAPATLLTINMVGNTVFKLSFGPLNDVIGSKRVSVISLLVLGISAFLLMTRNDILVCLAAFTFAACSLMSTTQIQLLAKDVWSKEEYPSALQVLTIAIRLSYALFSAVIGYLYDRWGNYTNILYMEMGSALFGMLCIVIMFHARGRKKVFGSHKPPHRLYRKP